MHRELWRRVAFTLGALFVWRLGQFIPVPGLDTHTLYASGTQTLYVSATIARVSILALSLATYVEAAVVLQIVAIAWPRLRTLRDTGERGRANIGRLTRILAAILAALQGVAIAGALERIHGAVPEPGPLFAFTTAATLAAGVLFLTWLADQMTARGIGNGIALLLMASVLVEVPRDLATLVQAARQGLISEEKLIAMVLLGLVFTVAAVMVERARRRIEVRFEERQIGQRCIEPQSVDLTFKLNPGGLVPAVVGSFIVVVVAVAAQVVTWLLGLHGPGDWLAGLANGRPLHLAVSAVVIILFAFVYTAFLHDPERLARQLRAQNGTVAELAPSAATAEYLDDTLSRLTALGAVYLCAILLLPIGLANWLGAPFAVGGASLLILVCTTIDIEAQVRALLARQH